MVAETIQVGEAMKCRAVGEEEIGEDGVEVGIAVMAIDHIKDQVILAASGTKFNLPGTALKPQTLNMALRQ